MRIVAVANQKGGVGKTTVTMQVGAALSRRFRVLVVDVDPQQSTVWWADNARGWLPFDFAGNQSPKMLARLRELGVEYDFVLVDTPGSLEDTPILETVLDAADYAVVPLTPEPLAVEPTMRTITRLIEPRQLRHAVLLNRLDPRIPNQVQTMARHRGHDVRGAPVRRVLAAVQDARRRTGAGPARHEPPRHPAHRRPDRGRYPGRSRTERPVHPCGRGAVVNHDQGRSRGEAQDARARVAEKLRRAERGLPKFARLTRKDARVREDQIAALTALTRTLMRRRQVKDERITENTLIRVAIDLLLAHQDTLRGATEDELRESVTPALRDFGPSAVPDHRSPEHSNSRTSAVRELRPSEPRDTPDTSALSTSGAGARS